MPVGEPEAFAAGRLGANNRRRRTQGRPLIIPRGRPVGDERWLTDRGVPCVMDASC